MQAQVTLPSYQVPAHLQKYFQPKLCGSCYICHLVGIFRAVRRVLRDDGTCWLNIAGCYAGRGGYSPNAPSNATGFYAERPGIKQFSGLGRRRQGGIPVGLKPKDWVAIPWMLGLALQADGWWLRSPIIWAKGLSFCETYSGSVMPESVRDRPTTSYEYLLLLTKSKRYYYDQDAVREPNAINPNWNYGSESYRRDIHSVPDSSGAQYHKGQIGWSGFASAGPSGAGRNLRSVWAINPHPFKEAHFATFPPKLVEPCIKAGTSERGCCPECGNGWERLVEKNRVVPEAQSAKVAAQDVLGNPMYRVGTAQSGLPHKGTSTTLGWRPGCSHGHDPIPCLVADIFSGAGTTVMVVLRLGRRAIGIELSEAYVKMSRRRIIADNPMFNVLGEAT